MSKPLIVKSKQIIYCFTEFLRMSRTTGKVLVEVSPDFYRPTDVVNLLGDPTKAKEKLHWNPQTTSFEELVRIMVEHDMEKVAVERANEHVKFNLEEFLEKGIIK
jgi:GDPmannose 4,6-dehydratase